MGYSIHNKKRVKVSLPFFSVSLFHRLDPKSGVEEGVFGCLPSYLFLSLTWTPRGDSPMVLSSESRDPPHLGSQRTRSSLRQTPPTPGRLPSRPGSRRRRVRPGRVGRPRQDLCPKLPEGAFGRGEDLYFKFDERLRITADDPRSSRDSSSVSPFP